MFISANLIDYAFTAGVVRGSVLHSFTQFIFQVWKDKTF